jgi:hypothetical protein
MRRLDTHIDIESPPEAVWKALTTFSAYGDWNPYLKEVQGELVQGYHLRVTVQPASGKARVFQRLITAVIPGVELSWKSKLIWPWLFQGKHTFRLTPLGSGGTRLENLETFSGLLTPLLWPMLNTSVRHQFEAMNHALKLLMEH